MTYSDLLERFDRKERGWLTRQCTGGRTALHDSFAVALGRTFDVAPPPSGSWWTIDYHLDWLAGASRWRDDARDEIHVGGGVTGTNEDLDLVVAAPDNLFFVEAKAAGSWDNNQLRSKVTRLATICPGGRLIFAGLGHSIAVRFALLSIGEAKRIDCTGWPEWMLSEGRPFIVDLQGPGRQTRLAVQRIHSADGETMHWKVVETKY